MKMLWGAAHIITAVFWTAFAMNIGWELLKTGALTLDARVAPEHVSSSSVVMLIVVLVASVVSALRSLYVDSEL